MSSSVRREVIRLPREMRMAKIIKAAREVFTDQGYNDALVPEIAKRAGVVEATVYHYFSTKRELLVKVVEDWFAGLLFDYDRQLPAVQGTWNRLRFMVLTHLRVIHREPAMARLVFNEIRPGPEYQKTVVYKLIREYTRRTMDIIEEAIVAGEFRAGVPLDCIRAMIYGGIEHHAFAYLRGEGDFSPEEAADAITDVIYRGLAKDGTAASQSLNNTIRQLETVVDRLKDMAGPRPGVEAEPRPKPPRRSHSGSAPAEKQANVG